MQMIILRQTRRGTRRIEIGLLGRLALFGAFFAIIALSFQAGRQPEFRLAHLSESLKWLSAGEEPDGQSVRPELYAAMMQTELARQRLELDSALESARYNVDALAVKLAELQARVIRLDALGERLVVKAKLEPTEFSFSEVPASGGPAPTAAENTDPVELVRAIDRLGEILLERQQMLSAIDNMLTDSELAEVTKPSGRPLDVGFISSSFGWRRDPVTGRRAMHYGIDFAGKHGDDIVAVAAGLVVFSGRRADYGNTVEIDHGNGYVTRYAHNSKNLISVGDRVAKGDPIALVGATGRATGSHIHFEVIKDGNPINPFTFITGKDGL